MLKFIALSGTIGVTENLYVYEYENDMIVVDCGVGFPEPEMLGVDLVIPDFSYIRQNRNKLRGILISHGHEDHLGALPFLLKDVKAPVYSSKLVSGFIKEKLDDYEIKGADLRVFDPEKDVLTLGNFRVTPFRVSHSVPDGVGFAIDTPDGRIFHVADYKFDWTPVDQRPFDINKAARSNRKVCFIGRSINSKAEIAKSLGYLHYPDNLVIDPRKAAKLPKDQIVYIISGSYGQPGSALYRLALGEHDFLSLEEGDIVVFSSDPAPPGSKTNVDFVVDKLIESNVDVHYYDMQEDLHVSGHGSIEDIKMLFALLSPTYFIPIGGTIRHMRAYSSISQGMGNEPESVYELRPGESIEFAGGKARKGNKIDVEEVLVDGLGIGDVGNIVLRDRRVLAREGIAIVLIQIDKSKQQLISDPEVISRGFVFQAKTKNFLQESGKRLRKQIEKRKFIDIHVVREVTVDFLERYFYSETGRRPMVLPIIVEI